MLDDIRALQRDLLEFERLVARNRAGSITKAETLATARALVDRYFRQNRGQLVNSGFSDPDLRDTDQDMQNLLDYTHRRTTTVTYKKLAKRLHTALVEVEKTSLAMTGAAQAASIGDTTDRQIVDTLKRLMPSAALSYEQGLIDLAGVARLSWRGPATDFRECLRETLDHLAPDEAVSNQENFKLETGTNGPTMKQKVRYVLRSRNRIAVAIQTSEAAVDAVEGVVGSFVRSVYTRSSVSTHTPTDRAEVVRVRDFVKVALCELLEIHTQ